MNYINYLKSKLALVSLMLIGAASSAMADNVLSIENFNIAPGETKTVEINLTNEAPVRVFMADVTLPEGLEYVSGSVEKNKDRVSSRSASANFDKQANGDYRATIFISNESFIAAGEGAVMSFKVKAGDDFAIGASNILVHDAYYTNADNTDVELNDVEVTVSRAKQLDGVNEFELNVEHIDVNPGETATFEVIFNNENEIANIEGTIVLPEGLKLVQAADAEDNSYFGYTDRVPYDMSISVNPGTGRFLFFSPAVSVIKAGNGVLFTVTVEADKTLKDGAEIVLKDFKIGDAHSEAYTLDQELKLTVGNLNEQAKPAADEAVKAQQDALAETEAAVEEADADVLEDEAVVAAKEAAEQAVEDFEQAVNDAYEAGTLANLNLEEEAAKVADAIENYKETADNAQKAFEEQKAAEEAARKDAEDAIAAAEKALGEAVPEEVAEDEDVVAAVKEAQDAIDAAKDALNNAETVKDNKEVADAIKAAEEAVKNAEEVAAAAKEAYDEQKAAEEAAKKALEEAKAIADEALKQVEEYARTQKNVFNGTTPDVAEYFLDQVDQLVEDLKQAVEDAYADGTLTDDFVDVEEAKNQIDAIYDEALKAQKALDDLKSQIADLQTALDAAKAIDLSKVDDEDAVKKIDDQIDELQDALDDALVALEDVKNEAADTSLEDVLGQTAEEFKEAVDKLIADAEELLKNITTSIAGVRVANSDVVFYTLDGVRIAQPTKGSVVIARMADGSTLKVRF